MQNRQIKPATVKILGMFFSLVLACASTLAQTGTNAETSPTPAATPTASATAGNSLVSPGRIDFNYQHTSLTDQYNFFFASPVFKGGFGFINSETGRLTEYQDAFFRPLLPLHRKDDLIVGVQRVQTKTESAWEFQTEYRLALGLGLGGGVVRRSNHALDLSFGKISYRKKHEGWGYILEAQAQAFAGKTSLGGYGAVYTDTLMFVVGTDREQWRATLGYSAKTKRGRIQPAFEIFYVDNNIGNLRGPKSYLINGSLGYSGGFLSHPVRLGRAMGPSGVEFGNPNGFLSPTANRRVSVWEMGDLVDFRLERVTQPNGAITIGRYEVAAFPFQFDQRNSPLDRLFGGLIYFDDVKKRSAGIQAGYFGKIGKIYILVKGEYILANHETGITLGIIRRF